MQYGKRDGSVCQRCRQRLPIDPKDDWCAECRRAWRVDYNARSVDKIRAYTAGRRWTMRANAANKRARDRGLAATLTGADVAQVWQEGQGVCRQCGSQENVQIDHIVPLRNGGPSVRENLNLLCGKCNHTKRKADNAILKQRLGITKFPATRAY